ncbi:unnamed protein product [Orchesella dallaii]|uniref:BPTI/Kunitz inhibitor domain-containing protein n=1 Tax=Orchesella dallaii TaxID=48710 RepID=A0ABP1PI75_9HEXA
MGLKNHRVVLRIIIVFVAIAVHSISAVPAPPQRNNNPCLLPPHQKGKPACLALLHRFTFNSTTGECENYFYGGCYGTENIYDSMEQCYKTCVVSNPAKSGENNRNKIQKISFPSS